MHPALTDFFSFLRAVPDVVWSGIIASFLTFIGVMLSNGSSTRRLKIQLKHDAQEKTKERISVLRRDVYLKTIEELNRANAKIIALAQADFVNSNPTDGLQDFYSAASKLQLIAEPKTSILASNLVASYGMLTMRLLTKLGPLNDIKIEINISDRAYEVSTMEVNRILEKQRLLVESGQPDQLQMAALNNAYDYSSAQAKKYSDQRAAAWEGFHSHHIEYVKLVMTELKTISKQQAPLMTAIRMDLGLTGQIEILQEHLDLQWKEMEQVVDDSLDAISKAR
ncbi:hypothetical protein [Pseudomonas germanica]|uniref:hypothetical protein n=1 Tax=Pseudomonas germanica TaxID=2815720 RepID=UPI002A4E2113|nr:hypothetical protein [Pseudomonas germanica]WPN77132.1 hypothetical protein QMK46_12420 [Pseudomonas germanica]